MQRHHLLIAGTGRAGTSALVRLLSACGLDTVLNKGEKDGWAFEANAGAESLILQQENLPYVIKSPWAYQYIDDLLDHPSIILDRVIIPLRRLAHAAESRIVVEMAAQNAREPALLGYKTPWSEFGITSGGNINSFEPLDQQRILGRSLHLLIEALEERAIPFTFLSFPRFVSDANYTWERLSDLFPEMTKPEFEQIFLSILDPGEVRTENEVEEARNYYAPQERNQEIRANIGELRIASLLREIKILKSKLAQSEIANPICNNPDEAPDGLSHGDAHIGLEGLQGWHWTTYRRPENPSYGYQIAHSDTIQISRIRRLTAQVWTEWKLLVGC